MDHSPPTLVIAGPTASGKSDLAVRVASCVGGEIVGADAFQIYRGIPILSAQPDAADLARVPHHLIGEVDPMEAFDVVRYLGLASERIAAIQARGKPAILVGGTGFYIRAVLRGLAAELPGPQPDLRMRLERTPLAELVAELVERDPEAAQSVDLRNPRRVIRALEVCLVTGLPFTSFRRPVDPVAVPVVRGIWIGMPRELLHARIEGRTRALFERGVVDEMRGMGGFLGPTAEQAIGVRELRAHLGGQLTVSEAIQKILEATRQYARRQETWFRKETGLLRVAPEDAFEAALGMVRGAGFEPATSCV